MPPIAVALSRLAAILFWPALTLVIWGELVPHMPDIIPGASDKLLHFTAYFGLAVLATVALGRTRAILVATMSLVVLGGVLEILQAFTGRDAEWLDEAANACGVLSGVALGLVLLRLVGRLQSD
jgi:VanZ family protein